VGDEPNKDAEDLDFLYSEIVQGYSQVSPKKGLDFFIKHRTHLEQAEIRLCYDNELKRAVKSGAKSEEDLVKVAIKNKWWSQAKEDEIVSRGEFLSRLKESFGRAYLKAQKDAIFEEIKEEKELLQGLKDERAALVSLSAESIAFKTVEELYIAKFIYLDKNLTQRAVSQEDLEYMSDEDVALFSLSSFSVQERVKDKRIKLLAASPFFQSLIRICPEDSAYQFYGKAVAELTVFQTSLFTYGNFYKKMIKNSTEKIPDHVFTDPEAMISWCESSGSSAKVKRNLERDPNAKKTKGERSGRISSIVGATQEDYQNLGLKENSPLPKKGLLELAKESGGELSIADAVKATESKSGIKK
jgi:hypothetical protein